MLESEFFEELALLKQTHQSMETHELTGYFVETAISVGGRTLFDIIRGADEEREVVAVLSRTTSRKCEPDLSVPLLGDCDGVPFGVTLRLRAAGVVQVGHPIIVFWNDLALLPAGPARRPRRRERALRPVE